MAERAAVERHLRLDTLAEVRPALPAVQVDAEPGVQPYAGVQVWAFAIRFIPKIVGIGELGHAQEASAPNFLPSS